MTRLAFIGENIFAADDAYPVGAFCMEETLTCGFKKCILEDVIKKNPGIGLHIIKKFKRENCLADRTCGQYGGCTS